MDIPGITFLSINHSILAEIKVIFCFLTPKQLVCYTSLVPPVHKCGKTHYTGHITKEGTKDISLDPGWFNAHSGVSRGWESFGR